MPEKLTLEQIMSDLQTQVKNKRFELETIGKEINKLLDEKLSIVNSINNTRQKLTELSEEKKKLEAENRAIKIHIKDQKDELSKGIIALVSDRDKFKAEKTIFEEDRKKELANLKSKLENLAKDKQTTKEAEQIAKEEAKKSQGLQSLLNEELAKAEKLQKDYEVKFKENKIKQDETIANIDKSKEIKTILDSKIIGADNLKKQYENLIIASGAKITSLDKQIEDNNRKAEKLEDKSKSFIQIEVNLGNRQIELNEREKQLNLKELRILKLAKDKDVQKELAQLEEELGIKK